ncbi:sensor domain-containing protein [Natronolimnohabitans innermongolicus]|uniref:Two-component system sensor kinase n=1 Tax=Natronolimnohabitans innermongolicus JCM 12255 TaxID=1227499 RepID=L9X031_9EURY|nr:sensor domain-containing protein [Natronolimnohabitans innermongolicus]ELY53973.1 two-component system sensor kinase [Natronolimnohabitans innermongolicus JCM 12255]
MCPPRRADATDGVAARDLVGIVADGQTYKNLLYLLLAFPLGFLYLMLVTFGFAFGTAFSIVLIGIPILIATVAGCRLLARLERRLANALLSTELERARDADGEAETANGLLAGTKRYLDAPSTWRGVGFLLLKFWVGMAGFVLLVLFLSALSIVTAPVRYPHEVEFFTVNSTTVSWTIDSLPEALLAVPIGAIAAIALLHVINAFAYVCGRIAESLLGDPASGSGSVSGAESTAGPPNAAAGSRAQATELTEADASDSSPAATGDPWAEPDGDDTSRPDDDSPQPDDDREW